jgi:hypothetical protein
MGLRSIRALARVDFPTPPTPLRSKILWFSMYVRAFLNYLPGFR